MSFCDAKSSIGTKFEHSQHNLSLRMIPIRASKNVLVCEHEVNLFLKVHGKRADETLFSSVPIPNVPSERTIS